MYKRQHINNAGCDYITTAHSRDYYDYSIGFRCCADEGSLPVEEREVDESFYANVAWIALGSGGLPGSNLALAFSLGAVLPVTTPRDHDRFASR